MAPPMKETVAALAKTLGVAADLPIPKAVAQMEEAMDIKPGRNSLPERVAILQAAVGGGEVDWSELTKSLPTGKDPESSRRRRELFKRFDYNGNGYLSLAEVDKAVRDELRSGELFGSKPVLMRAFQAAKGSSRSKSPVGAEYVERSEFRLLLLYLRQYFELYVAYSRLDSSDDKRLSLPEFRAGVGLLAQWGVTIDEANIESEFAKIDVNGGGIVLFEEFATWATSRQLDLEDDDEFDEDAAADAAPPADVPPSHGGGGGGKPSPAAKARPVRPLSGTGDSKMVREMVARDPGGRSPRADERPGTAGMEARGVGSTRLRYDRPLDMPPAHTRPLGPGPMPARMPARPMSAKMRSLSGSRGGSMSRSAHHLNEHGEEYKSASTIVRPTKPRTPGGPWSRSSREWSSTQHDPFITGGGKSVTNYPWGAHGGGNSVFPSSQPPMPTVMPGEPMRSAHVGAEVRSVASAQRAPARRPAPANLQGLQGDFTMSYSSEASFRR